MATSATFGGCPNCRSTAPIVYRGMMAYCTSCGAQRLPLVAKSTNHAGKPRIIGGALTRVLGWIVLAGGVSIGLGLLGLLQAIFPAGFAGYAVGLPIILIASILGAALLRGGRSLESTGVAEQRETRTSAVFSLAENRGGMVTAAQVANALGMGTSQADELLTSLAKSLPDHVVLEVDEHGGIFYRISSRGLSRVQSFDEKLRVATERQEDGISDADGSSARSVSRDRAV
jgi:hypothetical protein